MSQSFGPRHAEPTPEVMCTVCFRVTRACNLNCQYCQAPPNQRQLTFSQLVSALTFLAEHGTRRVKLTGGEPFVYQNILPLIEQCRVKGMEPTVITNGTLLPEGAVECLQKHKARVKISLHGPRDRHDAIQGEAAYDSAVTNLRRLVSAGVETSIHTLIYRDRDLNLPEWIEFLANEGVHKVSFMIFVPRGRGRGLHERWGFSNDEVAELSEHVAALATRYKESILVRFLDFVRKPYLVLETDGSLVWEVGSETSDSLLLSGSDLLSLTAIGHSFRREASPVIGEAIAESDVPSSNSVIQAVT